MDKAKGTKIQILDTSLKLFAQNSYHGASIRDIAGEIGKRESSIYNHFKSKEEILEQIISRFSSRNFGPIILTDKLINSISKPEKFFLMLAENLLQFWDTEEERMFIKILLSGNNLKDITRKYNLENYLDDFRSLSEIIFKEMIKHNYINKNEVITLSQEFINPLFLFEIEMLLGIKGDKEQKVFLKNHVQFFWEAIKR